jgi:HPt (histidine-containing phosphotransfer) domain-containing protein
MPAIDRAIFDELKQISGGDFINELIDAFLEDGPSMISAMEAALATRDVEVFRRNAHSLKSNANTFGAVDLGSLARDLEIMAKGYNLQIGTRLETLKTEYDRVAHELQGLRI